MKHMVSQQNYFSLGKRNHTQTQHTNFDYVISLFVFNLNWRFNYYKKKIEANHNLIKWNDIDYLNWMQSTQKMKKKNYYQRVVDVVFLRVDSKQKKCEYQAFLLISTDKKDVRCTK